MDAKRQLISELALFRGCNGAELGWISRNADVVDVPAGQLLALSFARSHEFVVVIEGVASAVTSDGETLMGPGSYFGELGLLDGRPHGATVEAKTPMRLLVLDGRVFRGMLAKMPAVGRRLMVGLAARLRTADDADTLRAVS